MSERRRGGFTLTELLVVVLLTGIIGSTIVACFAAGVSAWGHSRDLGVVDGDSVLAMVELARDAANGMPFPLVPFEGGPQGLSFAVAVPSGKPEEDVVPVSILEYVYDGEAKTLVKRIGPAMAARDENGPGDAIARGVESLEFSYIGDGGEWVANWSSPTSMPTYVRVRMAMRCGTEDLGIDQIVSIPVCIGAADQDASTP